MADYIDKHNKALDEIVETLAKLDEKLDRLEEEDSRAKAYFLQEQALHDIHKVARQARLAEEDEEAAVTHGERAGEAGLLEQAAALAGIDACIAKLDDRLAALHDDGKCKLAYAEQRKTLHEAKRMLHEAGRYDDYDEDELVILGVL